MADRPILMSASMVRALLDGRKTQTRRVMKSQPYTLRTEGFGYPTKAGGFVSLQSEHCLNECPYGKLGDRLWVKEALRYDDVLGLHYSADQTTLPIPDCVEFTVTRPHLASMFMPRWASRITLEVTEVRVQRLQEISVPDAVAEGIEPVVSMGAYQTFKNYSIGLPPAHIFARDSYQTLWESINGAGSWGANPWVWTVSFKAVQP